MNDDAEKLSLEQKADELYKIYIENENICGLTSLFKIYKVGSKTALKLKSIMYTKYGKDFLKKISAVRTSKHAHKTRSKESYFISNERRKKMRNGIKKYYENNQDARDRSRELMKKYCLPKCQTYESKKKRINSRSWYKPSEITKQKMSDAQKGKILTDEHKCKLRKPKKIKRVGFKHTAETKNQLSKITKEQWLIGIHKPIYKSKGQLEIINLIKESGYTVEDEYILNGKPYDIFVKEKNLLIEFNGTYWHRDPRFYEQTDDVQKIWQKDYNKKLIAESNGFKIKIIWQHDWESCKDKKSYIDNLINE